VSLVKISLGVLPYFLGEMCSNSAKVFQTVTWKVCPMRKLSSLAVLFVVAAVLCASTGAFAFDKNHLMKFKATNECPECDLSEADLSGANLQEANLERANLQRANVNRANLQGANLKGADLRGANLYRAKLQNADFTYAYIEGANMKGAKFCKTKMPWGLENKDCK
jgi:uncharacterized protein YjbI with pentapeptide repeats